MIFRTTLFLVTGLLSYSTFAKDKVLAQAGDVKIIERNCNSETYECDYVKTYQGKREVLIEKWNRSAVPYQFNSNLIALRLGLTGSPHSLTIYDSNNRKTEFWDVLHVDAKKMCFLNQESDGKNKSKIVFYRLPSLKPYFTISRRDKDLNGFERVWSKYLDEENGSFNFMFNTTKDGEFLQQEVKVEQACSLKPKVIVRVWEDNRD
ncbi:hypothetical protein G9F32_06035 [Acinetobacter sp. 194]|uniref:hypothetical protein n=1 Tax=Acinetobacter shaoyimingii TaxID=2715164 RepID=UPI00140DE0E8|nr:hypothetical protein [Acinetobacter shaoyimingii]NHB57599.1 hypothetical protein [Acinetobacter shaoyimingii]